MGPEDGHTFEFSMRVRGSYGVRGEPGHHDSDWWSEPCAVSVRAWNLRDALRKVNELPLSEWFLSEEEDE